MKKIFYLDDIVQMKKVHPCGSNEWKIIRLGADIKIKCCKCGRIVMFERNKFDKDVKKILKQNIPESFESSGLDESSESPELSGSPESIE